MPNKLHIKEAIKRNGLTINKVAETMGINRVTLSNHINGNPSVEILFRIAAAIGCNVRDFFNEPETKEETKEEKKPYIICPHCGKEITISVE